MEAVLLSLLLTMSSSGADVSSSGARAQAVASAKIISGERVRLGREDSASQSKKSKSGDRSYLLPMVRTKGTIEKERQLNIIEFH